MFNFLTRGTAVAACSSLCLSLFLPFCAHALEASFASTHAPIGIMGDHLHKKGEWMVSYRAMQMDMSGNLLGDASISDDDIVTSQPNRFAGMPMMPPTLRVVPQDMTTTMHMFGAMYAPTDNVTLVAMVNYLKKEMTLRTFQGGMGTNVLGDFKSESSGIGDTKLGVLYRLAEGETHRFHGNFTLSLPTGSITEEGRPLTPMNMRPLRRLPYPMQLGTGTYDITPGVTYTGSAGIWAWGAQALYTLRTGENDEGYTVGDESKLNTWLQLGFSEAVSGSLGLEHKSSDAIDGIDVAIALPVHTADPANSGRDLINVKLGVNTAFTRGALAGHRFAFEYVVPIEQDVNGLQMEMQSMWTLGYQKAF